MDTAPALVTDAGAILHVGCGGDPLPVWMTGTETRLDLDPDHNPDILADMRAIGDIGPFDTVFSSHALEHIYPHEVIPTLADFRRVLNDGGAAIIVVPDLEDIRPTTDILYHSPAGPICGLDMYYGKASLIEAQPLMGHKCGFTSATLKQAMLDAGFATVHTVRGGGYTLIGIGRK